MPDTRHIAIVRFHPIYSKCGASPHITRELIGEEAVPLLLKMHSVHLRAILDVILAKHQVNTNH